MALWPWIERKLSFEYPPTKLPDLLERVRGTPARLQEMVLGLDAEILAYHDGQGWSIQENIGHLLDLEALVQARIGQVLAGVPALAPADMSNRKTHEANHNATPIDQLLRAFRSSRAKTVAQFERLDASDWAKAAFHERLQMPMRIVDIACMRGTRRLPPRSDS